MLLKTHKIYGKERLNSLLQEEQDMVNGLGFDLDMDMFSTHYFEVWNYDKMIGVLALRDVCGRVLSFHGGIFKEFRGKDTVNIVKQLLQQIRDEVDCVFITTIEALNIRAIKFTEKLGFKQQMVIKKGSPEKTDVLVFGEA